MDSYALSCFAGSLGARQEPMYLTLPNVQSVVSYIADGRILDFEVPETGSALVNAWGPISLTRVTFHKDDAPAGKALMFAENRGTLLLEQVQVLNTRSMCLL